MNHDFLRFAEKISEYNNNSGDKGIGTLSERCLHSIIKSYYEEDTSKHEVKVCGFVADIKNDCGIIEIQTNNFHPLNKKLEKYLEENNVTIVYPVSHIKHIVWVDPISGEIVKRNKSPKKGNGMEFLYEASRIRKYLTNKRLSFEILLIDMDEYRLLNGWGKGGKRGSVRCDRKPISLYDVIRINGREDIAKILPPDFPSGVFKFSEFEKVTKMRGITARYSMNALIDFGAVEVAGKDKNSFIYRLTI